MDLNDPNVRIQYLVKKQVDIAGKPVEFNDAIYFDPDEFDAIAQEEVDVLVQERVDNFVETVTNPAPPPDDGN